jgi:hypothetical protein
VKYDNVSGAIAFRKLLDRYNHDDIFPEARLSLYSMVSVVEAYRVMNDYHPEGIVPGIRYDGVMLIRDSTNISIKDGLYMDWIIQVKDNLDMVFKEIRVAGRHESMKPLMDDPALVRFADQETDSLNFKDVPAGLVVDPTYLLTGYADCLAALLFNNDNIVEVERAITALDLEITQYIEVAINGVMHCIIEPGDTLRIDGCPDSYDYIKVYAVMAAMSQKIYSMNIVLDRAAAISPIFAVEPL